MIFRARVFDKDGDRFLIPGFWYSDDDPDAGMGSHSICLTESMLFSVVLGAKATGWVEVVADEAGHGAVAHFCYRFVGPQFANGAVDVLLIGGPKFDEEMAAAISPAACAL